MSSRNQLLWKTYRTSEHATIFNGSGAEAEIVSIVELVFENMSATFPADCWDSELFPGSVKFLLVMASFLENLIETTTDKIRSFPKALWPQLLKKLQKIYGFPIHVFSIHDGSLPLDVADKLQAQKLAYSTNVMGTKITTLYFAFDKATQVLAIGPLDYIPIKNRISNAIPVAFQI